MDNFSEEYRLTVIHTEALSIVHTDTLTYSNTHIHIHIHTHIHTHTHTHIHTQSLYSQLLFYQLSIILKMVVDDRPPSHNPARPLKVGQIHQIDPCRDE